MQVYRKKRWYYFRLLALLFVMSSAGTGLVAFFMVKKFTSRPLYSPERVEQHAQNRKRLMTEFQAKSIAFYAADGVALSGLLIERANATRVWLLCHGYRMAKERMLPFVEMFPNDTIFMFDYRAHGESAGNRVTYGHQERQDVCAAAQFLQTHQATAALPLFGLGISMGAVSLLGAACQYPLFKGIVLDSPFARLDKQIERMVVHRYNFPSFVFPRLGRSVFERELQFPASLVDSCLWAAQVPMPVLLIHSHDDAVSFFADALAVHDAVQSPKDFWAVPHCNHAHIFQNFPQEYAERVEQFIAQKVK